MNRRWAVGITVFLAIVLVAIGLTLITRNRVEQNRLYTLNNLRELSYYPLGASTKGPEVQKGTFTPLERTAIPAGTIVRPDIPINDRLSWLVDALPYLNQKRQNTSDIQAKLNLAKPWTFEANRNTGATILDALLPPGSAIPVRIDNLAPTHYVGIGGLGSDAPELAFSDPTAWRIGSFRYNGDMPFSAFKDGMSTTLLLGETNMAVGAWLCAGYSTVRPIDDAKSAFAPVGAFGGVTPHEAAFGFADGSAKYFKDSIDPRVMRALATVAGGTNDPTLAD